MTRQRVAVALSGGVDSSTAAALLLEQGYEVVGLMMRLWSEPGPSGAENRCCSPGAVDDARRVCDHLGIPFYLINCERPFKNLVVDYFIREYIHGRTPNPCLACNRHIKFGLLLRRALALDAVYLATGHYARRRQGDNGCYELWRGVDRQKDQSYFLYMLGQQELAHTMFPVGDYTKDQVRAMAQRFGLSVARKDESQEVCFIREGDYREFLRRHAPESLQPGPIVTRTGKVLGQHKGLPCYTIGQREGLGISASEALYVLELDATRNALVVGPKRELGRQSLLAEQASFVSGLWPDKPFQAQVRIRYRATEVSATIIPLKDGRLQVDFSRSLRDITPGQGVVFYQGEVVLGGAIIERALGPGHDGE